MKQRSCSFQNTSSSKPTVVPEIPIQEAATPPAWLLPTQPENCHVQQRLESGVRGTRLGPGRLPLPSSPAPVPWPWAAPHSPDPTGRGGGAGHRRPGRRRLPRLNAGASRCLRDPQHAEGVQQGVTGHQPRLSLTSRRHLAVTAAGLLLLPPLLLTSTSLCRKVDQAPRQTLKPNVVKGLPKSGI